MPRSQIDYAAEKLSVDDRQTGEIAIVSQNYAPFGMGAPKDLHIGSPNKATLFYRGNAKAAAMQKGDDARVNVLVGEKAEVSRFQAGISEEIRISFSRNLAA